MDAAGQTTVYTDAEGHWDASSAIQVSGSTVQSWTDVSGNGYDVTGNAEYTANGLNGHPAIRFSGSGHAGGSYLISTKKHTTNCAIENSFTWVVVMKITTDGGWMNVFSPQDACSVNPGGYHYYPWSMADNGVHGWAGNHNWAPRNPVCDVNQMCV